MAGGNLQNDSIQSVFTSGNNGLSWDFRIDYIAPWLRSVDFSDTLNGICVGYSGHIIKTVDGGNGWAFIASPLNRDFNEVVYVTSQILIAVGGRNRENDTLQTIIKSSDGGNNWTVVRDIADNWLKSVFFTDINNGVAVGDAGVILSTVDGGDTWQPVASPLQRDFNSVFFLNSNTAVIVGGDMTSDSLRTILRTTNGGANWQVIVDEQGSWLTDVTFLDLQQGYAVGKNAALLKTIDGGQSWLPEIVNNTTGDEYFESVNFSSNSFGIITGSWGAIYVYSDVEVPQANTLAALVNGSDVTLQAEVNTFGEQAIYSFLISEDPSFVNPGETPPINLNSNSLFPISYFIQGLNPDTTYYYTIKVATLGGVTYGDTLSFYTYQYSPDFQTRNATDITEASATLNGRVNHLASFPVTLSFEYGITPALGSSIDAVPQTINDGQLYDVTAQLSGLQAGISYYYRLKGVSQTGTLYGDTRFFFPGEEIPNWEFENWIRDTVDIPTHWTVFGEGFEKVPGNLGGLALKLTGVNGAVLGVPAMEKEDGALPFVGGIPYQMRPDSVSVFLNYYVETGDSAGFAVQFYSGSTIYASDIFPITGNSAGVFEELRFPLTYDLPGIPDSVVIAFVTSFSSSEHIYLNNFIIADDITFFPSAPPVTGGDFENWHEYISTQPEVWSSLFYVNTEQNGLPVVEQTLFAPGDTAIEIKNIMLGGRLYRGQLTSGPNYFQKISRPPDFPVLNQYQNLFGYYKFFPDNGDTMNLQIEMFYQGEVIGSGNYQQTETVSEFTPFSVPIHYGQDLIPDSAEIKIQACLENPRGLSRIEIDKLSFNSLPVQVGSVTTGKMMTYPNPAVDQVIIQSPEFTESYYTVQVTDASGRVVSEIKTVAAGKKILIDVSVLNEGIYFIRAQGKNKTFYNKVVIANH